MELPHKLLSIEGEEPTVQFAIDITGPGNEWDVEVTIMSRNRKLIKEVILYHPNCVDGYVIMNNHSNCYFMSLFHAYLALKPNMLSERSLKVHLKSRRGALIEVDCPLEERGPEESDFERKLSLQYANNVLPLPEGQKFGIELELSCKKGSTKHRLVDAIRRRAGVSASVNAGGNRKWKLVDDGSIECNASAPTCSKFELVSPILQGESAVKECYSVIEAIKTPQWSSITVNRSMGFHVHVDVQRLSLADLKKVCQNFVSYEDAMDLIMPPSRRTGSPESAEYCRSNKSIIRLQNVALARSHRKRHKAIDTCKTLRQLCNTMNPDHCRYFKLNLMNIHPDFQRQPTIEFRQHSGTASADKVSAWIRFCIAFVRNSVDNPRVSEPIHFGVDPYNDDSSASSGESYEDRIFTHLFDHVIKDRILKKFYKARRDELVLQEYSFRPSAHSRCGCAKGGTCSHSD